MDSITRQKFRQTPYWRIQQHVSSRPKSKPQSLPERIDTPPAPKRQSPKCAFEQLSIPQRRVFREIYNKALDLPVDEDLPPYPHWFKTKQALRRKGWITWSKSGSTPTKEGRKLYEEYLQERGQQS